MGDEGTVWACDRTPSRLKKVSANARRLNLSSLQIHTGDSRQLAQFHNRADRVLVDAPCSGLGTLHRHADARWRQSPEAIQDLAQLQQQLLTEATRCVRPGGSLVYATCTLHPTENEKVVTAFLNAHPEWSVKPPTLPWAERLEVAPQGWIRVWPHRHQMDGFFMVQLVRQ
jgi:16S rRNA (cytosine967-C5)-methyltransferase